MNTTYDTNIKLLYQDFMDKYRHFLNKGFPLYYEELNNLE
jgi:hypothetical protein